MSSSIIPPQVQSRARGGFRLRHLLWTLLLALLPLGAEAAEYRLGAQDKLRVKVVEWRAGSLQLRSAKGALSTLRKPCR